MRISADLRIRAVMDENVILCAAHDAARDVLHRLLDAAASHAVVVGIDGQPIGIVRAYALFDASPDEPVTRFMRPTVLWISEHESVAVAVRVMAMSLTDFLLVHDDEGQIVGALAPRNLIGLGGGLDSVELAG